MFAVVGDLANAYNTIEWKDAVPFLAIIIGLYWVKVKIDTRAGLGTVSYTHLTLPTKRIV